MNQLIKQQIDSFVWLEFACNSANYGGALYMMRQTLLHVNPLVQSMTLDSVSFKWHFSGN